MGLFACGQRLYELPDPPPSAYWQRHSLNPGEEEVRSADLFAAAEGAIVEFVGAVNEQRWDDAYRLLSNETRILLDDVSPTGLGEAVLEFGLVQRDGAEFRIDPMDLYVVAEMVELLDEMEGEPESETYRRKEIWAVSELGFVNHEVMIFEEDGWRIHKPTIELSPGSPGRRTLEE